MRLIKQPKLRYSKKHGIEVILSYIDHNRSIHYGWGAFKARELLKLFKELDEKNND